MLGCAKQTRSVALEASHVVVYFRNVHNACLRLVAVNCAQEGGSGSFCMMSGPTAVSLKPCVHEVQSGTAFYRAIQTDGGKGAPSLIFYDHVTYFCSFCCRLV